MKRFAFLGIALLGGLASPALAQSAGKTYRVGILSDRTVPSDRPFLDAFRRAMSGLGYEEGKNLEIVYRYTGGHNTRLPALAAELVRANVDVIVASSSPVIAAMQHATTSVPIVMLGTSDPFRFVASLARPGGNITGLDPMESELEGKRLQLLKELAPRVGRVAVMRDPSNPGNLASWRAAQREAHRLGIAVFAVDVGSAQQIDAAFETIRRLHTDAVLVLPAGVFNLGAAHIVRLVTAQRLPAVYSLIENVPAQRDELMMYGASNVAAWGQAADYVDRILKGAKPADLPVERPTTFELIVNLKAAHDIGITVPQSILLQATQVIH